MYVCVWLIHGGFFLFYYLLFNYVIVVYMYRVYITYVMTYIYKYQAQIIFLCVYFTIYTHKRVVSHTRVYVFLTQNIENCYLSSFDKIGSCLWFLGVWCWCFLHHVWCFLHHFCVFLFHFCVFWFIF